jgi:2-polyprenyl-3-methyl-5-hydroxy-6-metoxy-1,4-benzoquinol methylase
MPDTAVNPALDTPIDTLFQQTHDEYVRTRYIAKLHNHLMMNVRYGLREVYEDHVEPKLKAELGEVPRSGHEISKAIEGNLRLDPAFETPNYITALDVHLIPGGYHTEFAEDDVAQGFLLGARHSGPAINPAREFGFVGYSVAAWLKHRYPEFSPKAILDMGTQWGSNLIAYNKEYPGAELYGIDIAAPSLRYGHAKAEQAGVKIHLSQQNAECTDFADNSFDLVVSSFVLHEIAVKATKNLLAEAHRVLKPGGIMVHVELPPHKSCEPFLNFMFDWDTRHNNEPNYRNFRSQDPSKLMADAGFPAGETFETTIPDLPTTPPDKWQRIVSGEDPAPIHGRGAWFIFGGRKA